MDVYLCQYYNNRMKTLLKLLLLIPLLCNSQTITWDKIYDLNQQDFGYGIVQSNDGGYVLTGYTGGYEWPNLLVMKLDSNGDTIWSKIYADVGHSQGFSICKSPDNGYVVSGFTCENENYWNYVMYILKIDENGDTVWSKKFGNGNTFARRVIPTLDGGYAVLGGNYTFIATQVIFLKLKESGEEQWSKIYNFNSSPSLMFSIEQSVDSSYILAGRRPAQTGYDDIWLMKLDKFGDTLWTKTYGEQGIHESGYYALPATGGGYIISAKRDTPNYLDELIFIKTNFDGDLLWEKSYGENISQVINVIRNTSDFGYIGTGSLQYNTGLIKVYIVKLNYQGDTLWTKLYPHEMLSSAFDIRQTNDQGYIVCGGTSNGTGFYRDIRVLKLNEFGLVSEPENKLNTQSNTLRIYPNPFNNYTNVEFDLSSSEPEINVMVYSVFGEKVEEFKLYNFCNGRNSIRIETRYFKPGIYYCLMKTNENIYTARMIKMD
jgi:hypothetical protein